MLIKLTTPHKIFIISASSVSDALKFIGVEFEDVPDTSVETSQSELATEGVIFEIDKEANENSIVRLYP